MNDDRTHNERGGKFLLASHIIIGNDFADGCTNNANGWVTIKGTRSQFRQKFTKLGIYFDSTQGNIEDWIIER